jgi:hypothetical protein
MLQQEKSGSPAFCSCTILAALPPVLFFAETGIDVMITIFCEILAYFRQNSWHFSEKKQCFDQFFP